MLAADRRSRRTCLNAWGFLAALVALASQLGFAAAAARPDPGAIRASAGVVCGATHPAGGAPVAPAPTSALLASGIDLPRPHDAAPWHPPPIPAVSMAPARQVAHTQPRAPPARI